MTTPTRLLSALAGAMGLDGLLSAAARRTARLFGQIRGQVFMGIAQGGPQDGAEVGLVRPRVEGAEGPGGRAHPHRHFGDLCPGRQSQLLAPSRVGTQEDQEPDTCPHPTWVLWSWRPKPPPQPKAQFPEPPAFLSKVPS